MECNLLHLAFLKNINYLCPSFKIMFILSKYVLHTWTRGNIWNPREGIDKNLPMNSLSSAGCEAWQGSESKVDTLAKD